MTASPSKPFLKHASLAVAVLLVVCAGAWLHAHVPGLARGMWRHAITLTPPEPESFTMLLAGLGAIGFMARRRRFEAPLG